MIFHVAQQSDFIAQRNQLMNSFALLDGVSDANQMFNKIMVSHYIAYATDNGVVAGTYGFGRVEEGNPCLCSELLEHVGAGAKMVFNINIYVRAEYRGSNLALDLQSALTQDAVQRGFTHAVGYFPETEEIKSWREAQPNTTIIHPTSIDVDWISVRPLTL